MAIDLSEDTSLEPVPPTPVEETPPVDDEQSVDQADETEAPEEVEEPAEPAAAVVEGPTIAGKMAAEQAGLHPELVALASSDQQLMEFTELFNRTAANMTDENSPPLELELPLDEYPEGDPVRKEFQKLQTHFQSELSRVKQQLQETGKKTSEFEKQQIARQESEARRVQTEFDKVCDELQIEAFGNAKNMTPVNLHMRTAAFNMMQEMQAANPGASVADITRQVVETIYPTNGKMTAKKKEAIRKQSNGRLGSNPSQPATPGYKSDEQRMREFLEAAGIAGR